jgi:hypothetical protein
MRSVVAINALVLLLALPNLASARPPGLPAPPVVMVKPPSISLPKLNIGLVGSEEAVHPQLISSFHSSAIDDPSSYCSNYSVTPVSYSLHKHKLLNRLH